MKMEKVERFERLSGRFVYLAGGVVKFGQSTEVLIFHFYTSLTF